MPIRTPPPRPHENAEIPFIRHFHEYQPRLLADIEADIEALEQDIMAMLKEVTT